MSKIIEISTKPSKLDAMIIENISFNPEIEKMKSFYSLSYQSKIIPKCWTLATGWTLANTRELSD